MKSFSYRGFDQAGKGTAGMVEALDLKEAREKLLARGILAEQLGAAGKEGTASRSGRRRFGPDSRSLFYRELHALLGAGLPLASALEILIETPELESQRDLFAGMRDAVREGETFSHALGSVARLSLFEKALLDAGTESGSLVSVLDHLAAFLEDQKRIADRIQTALVYPALVLFLALGIGIFILNFLLPRVEQMLVQTRMELPALTRFMFSFGNVAGILLPAGVLVLAVAGTYLRAKARTEEGLGLRWAATVLRLPLAGRVAGALVKLRFSRTLSLLLRGGVPLVDGLHLAGRATGNAWVEGQVAVMARKVKDGMSLGKAIREVVPLGEDLPGWISAGEASGDLPDLLDRAADRFGQAWDRALSRFLALFEPALILAVGLFVFLVALAVLLPLVRINQGLV